VDVNTLDWRNSPVKGGDTTNPWFLETRPSADGDKASQFISSLSPGGEKLTGILRSRQFNIPARLSFFMAGHDGSPDKPPRKKNLVRLRDAATQQVLAHSAPPRNDLAQPFTWDLSAYRETGLSRNRMATPVTPSPIGGRFSRRLSLLPRSFPIRWTRQIAASRIVAPDKTEPKLAGCAADSGTRFRRAKAFRNCRARCLARLPKCFPTPKNDRTSEKIAALLAN
jgi:hypothetical protein